jgi:TolB-like protein/Tfp pilus assembly protein PilF
MPRERTDGLLARLKERKLVQWALAYLGVAWLSLQLLDVLADIFPTPLVLQQGFAILLVFGLLLTVVFAWYHGEKGRQRVTGVELLIVASLTVLAGTALLFLRGTDVDAETEAAHGSGASGELDDRFIAVLPFVDMSGEDQAYFADGISEELVISLTQVPELRVAARTSSFAFRDSALAVPEIGQRLGVGSVVEGTVRKSRDQLRISAQLIDVESGFPVWSERYNRRLSDVLAVQEEIASAIVSALRVELGANGDVLVRGQPSLPEAQDAFMRGRFAWNQRSRESLERAVEEFRAAVTLDSEYGRAWAGLGDTYAILGFYDYRPPREAFPAAKAAAVRALELEPSLAEAHATLGYVALYYDWNWPAAEESFARAVDLDPQYATAHQWLGNYFVAMGRHSEAERAMRTASTLDPLSLIAHAAIGWAHFYAGDFEQAIERLSSTLERDEDFQPALLWSGQAYAELGNSGEAERLVRRVVELSGGSAIAEAALAGILARAGEREGALAILDRLENGASYVPSYEIARVHVALGQLDRAVEWLERAYEEKAHSMAFLGVDPLLGPLAGHDGFERLRQQLGLNSNR